MSLNFNVSDFLRPLGRHVELSLFPKRKKRELVWNTHQLDVAQRSLLETVKEQEQMHPRLKRTSQVDGWLKEAENLVEEVQQLVRSLSSDVHFWSLWSNHHLARTVEEMIRRVDDLRQQRQSLGENLVSTIILPQHLPNTAFVPYQLQSMVGGEETLSEIKACLSDSSVRTIGIVGMGGIGKTAIMKKLQFDLSRDRSSDGFQPVIWVDVSKVVDTKKIQKMIAYNANFHISPEEEDFQTADIIYRTLSLSRKKFIILLDDVWEKLDFERIGIPLSSDRNAAKIIFTTRSEEVCNDMDTDRIVRVPLLNPEQSMDLFKQKLSSGHEVLDDQSLGPRVKSVVARCGGLPLLLIAVARATARYKTIPEWSDVDRNLNSSPGEIPGMEEVISVMTSTFDHLRDANIKQCLLYCLMICRRDTPMDVDRLVRYWSGEGFLDMPTLTSFQDAQNEGIVVVNKLKRAFLLEPGHTDSLVKMHEAVRLMALSLTSGNRFLVYDPRSVKRIHDCQTWAAAERISLEECEIQHLPPEGQVPPNCPRLVTLIVRGNSNLQSLSPDFFTHMLLLRVLDLSHTSLLEIPASIGLLVELQYLGLEGVSTIRSLPVELGNLVKLRQLHLEGTVSLDVIPRDVILKMSMLQLINLYNSKYELVKQNSGQATPLLGFGDLEKLKHLDDLGMVVKSKESLKAVLDNQFIRSVITSLYLESISEQTGHGTLLSTLGNLPKLMDLYIDSCVLPDELQFETNGFVRLKHLRLRGLEISTVKVATTVATVAATLPTAANVAAAAAAEEATRVANVAATFPTAANVAAAAPAAEAATTATASLSRAISTSRNITNSNSFRSTRSLKNVLVLYITRCSRLRELTWAGQLPLLEQIHLKDCESVENMIRGSAEDPQNCYFPKLFNFTINNLQGLTRICSSTHQMLFPSLKFLEVSDCPKLKNLSLGLDSCPNMVHIRGEQQWWDGLEWMDEQVKSVFLRRFSKVED